MESVAEKQDIVDELIDRYSDPPDNVLNIIDVAYAKNLASKSGISEIKQNKKGFDIIYEQKEAFRFGDVITVLDVLKCRYSVKTYDFLRIRVETNKKHEALLEFIIKLMENVLINTRLEVKDAYE